MPAAWIRLGDFYKNDKDSVDYTKAIECFRNAIAAGSAVAFVRMGDCYYIGYGVEVDNDSAKYYYQKAYQAGVADGAASLGSCYLYGKGVKKDTAKALSLHRLPIVVTSSQSITSQSSSVPLTSASLLNSLVMTK